MRGVDQVLEFVGGTAPTRDGKKVCDVVPERRVVRVLLDRHELHGVVPQRCNPRNHFVRELDVRVDFGLDRGHTDVRFIDAHLVRRLGPRVLELVNLLRGRVVVNAVEGNLVGRLHGHLNPRGDLVNWVLAFQLKVDLDACAVRNGHRAVGVVGHEHLEHAEVVLGHPHAVRARGPPVEVAEQTRGFRTWRPLSVRNTRRIPSEAHDFVASGEFFQAALVLVNRVADAAVLFPPVRQVVSVLVQGSVEHTDTHPVRGDGGVLERFEPVRGFVDGFDFRAVNGADVGPRGGHGDEILGNAFGARFTTIRVRHRAALLRETAGGGDVHAR